MKGKYNGCHMTVYGTVLPKASALARGAYVADNLSDRAKQKLKIIDWHKKHGNNCSLTARHFGIGRMTLYRWLKRLEKCGIMGLNDRSKKPKKVRRPTTPWQVTSRIVELRKEYPTWSKYKLKALLKKEGIIISESTVGRVLKRKDMIDKRTSRKRKKASLRPKARFPKGMRISRPGDLIQIDVKHITLVGGRKFYQFTAIDVLSKIRVLRVYPSESSRNGMFFLKECVDHFPFQIRALQTDNGSSFLKHFESFCEDLEIPHYFTYPRNPKQNSYVEISHQADEREFYLQGQTSSFLDEMRKRIHEREFIWNNIRPHAALDYLTPYEYLLKLKEHRLPTKKVIILQT
jgi:transposase InsO family protein